MYIRYPAKTSTFGIKSTMVPIIRNYDKNEFGKENLPKKSFFGSDQTTFSCQKWWFLAIFGPNPPILVEIKTTWY